MNTIDEPAGTEEVQPMLLLRPTQAAAWLHKTTSTLARWRADLTGPPFVQFGNRRVAYVASDLEAYLDGRAPAELRSTGHRVVGPAFAAACLLRSPITLQRWREEGAGPDCIVTGDGSAVYDLADLVAYVDACRVVPTGVEAA